MKLNLLTVRSLILEKYLLHHFFHPLPPVPSLPQVDTRNCDLHCSFFGTDSRVRIFESVGGGDGHG